METIRKIKYGILNLISYFKIIWNDRQWDFVYIEVLLLHKYTLMYKRMCSDNCPIDWNVNDQYKSRQALKICIDILTRRKEDFYIDLLDETKNGISYIIKTEERDWDIYCKLINKYHQSWWD